MRGLSAGLEEARLRDARRSRDRRHRWARKYRPNAIDLLLIAEAPPAALDRYFYFPVVSSHDSLFREVVRVVLRRTPTRDDKRTLLEDLQRNGVFLIDARLDPLVGRLVIDTSRLVARVRRLRPRRIIIVKVGVYAQAYRALREAGMPVIDARIPFPASGQQVRFRQEMGRALRRRPPAFQHDEPER